MDTDRNRARDHQELAPSPGRWWAWAVIAGAASLGLLVLTASRCESTGAARRERLKGELAGQDKVPAAGKPATPGQQPAPKRGKAAPAGTTYYVDSAIPDTRVRSALPDCVTYDPSTFSCSGGSACAYKSIDDVNACTFNPDDQVLFRRGQTWEGQLIVPSSGTAGRPITFGAYGHGANPLIKATAKANGIAAYGFTHDIIIDSIDVSGGKDVGIILWDAGLSDIIIRNLTVSGATHSGIYVGSVNTTIKDVVVHDNGSNGAFDHGIYFGPASAGQAENFVADGIVAYGNSGYGIQAWNCGSGQIKNSTIYSNGRRSSGGGGIAVGAYRTTATLAVHHNLVYSNLYYSGLYMAKVPSGSRLLVYNNTFYGNGASHFGGGIKDDGSPGGAMIRIRNNIFSCNTGGAADMQTGPPSTSDYNLFYDPGGTMIDWQGSRYASSQWAAYRAASGQDVHSITANPDLTNPAAADFSLRSASPAIGRGTNLGSAYASGLAPGSCWPSSVRTIRQDTNGPGWDIGAYVHRKATAPPSP